MIYLYRRANKETAHDEIKKQALLEVLFRTQLWNQPYLRENPFLYISPRQEDFAGDDGRILMNQFKSVFASSYKHYSQAFGRFEEAVRSKYGDN